MPDQNALQAMSELLKACSHPTRLAILQELLAGPKCVSDMEDLLRRTQANISQHLAVLRYTKLVDYAQDGALRCYYLCRPQLVQDLFAVAGRPDLPVKRSSVEIRASKLQTQADQRISPSGRPVKKRLSRAKVAP